MPLQIVKIQAGPASVLRTHVIIGCLDTAVEFAAWCEGLGYMVEIFEGEPAAHPYTPEELDFHDALIRMYQHTLASRSARA